MLLTGCHDKPHGLGRTSSGGSKPHVPWRLANDRSRRVSTLQVASGVTFIILGWLHTSLKHCNFSPRTHPLIGAYLILVLVTSSYLSLELAQSAEFALNLNKVISVINGRQLSPTQSTGAEHDSS